MKSTTFPMSVNDSIRIVLQENKTHKTYVIHKQRLNNKTLSILI